MAAPHEERTLLQRAEPWLFRVVALVLACTAGYFGIGLWKSSGAVDTPLAGHRAVVFDVIKLANAQRQLASTFMGKAADAGANAPLLLEVQANTQQVIRDVAGAGTIVLVKQAVVHTELPDITDEVLKRLKLPTSVPTPSGEVTLDYAPTVLSMTPQPPPYKPVNSGAPASPGKGLLP